MMDMNQQRCGDTTHRSKQSASLHTRNGFFISSIMFAVATFAPLTAQSQSTPAKVSASKSTPAAVKRYTAQQFLATTNLRGISFSADEKRVLFSSNESGIFNAYAISVTGGKAEALTTSKSDTTYSVGFFPNDDRMIYTRDNGGDENSKLYVRELDGSEKALTPGAKFRSTFMGFKRDDSAFYIGTNERDPKFFDIYL